MIELQLKTNRVGPILVSGPSHRDRPVKSDIKEVKT